MAVISLVSCGTIEADNTSQEKLETVEELANVTEAVETARKVSHIETGELEEETTNSGEVKITMETLENPSATAAITTDQEMRKSQFIQNSTPNLSTALEYYESELGKAEFYGEGYDRVTYYVGLQNESVISLYYKQESYSVGGMHGNTNWSTVNYDKESGKILSLEDMFEENSTAIVDIKENILNQCSAQNIVNSGWQEQAINEIVEGENWYLAEDGIHFWANEYVLGGFGEIFEFVIGYDQLTGWKK